MANIYCFESTDAGAPSLNNAAGSLIGLLDACLISGYNNKAVTSITVASGVATVVCTAHGFSALYGKIINISGATPAGLNIATRITDVTTNGFKFLCTGVADGVATGTIVAKYAPVGWTKPFSATNKAMYKRSDILASNCMLRIDDTTVGITARALMVQGATDLDTYYNPSPTATQIAGGLGLFVLKAQESATPTPWMLISDGLLMYVFCATTSAAGPLYMPMVFGDIVSFKPNDRLNCLLAANQGGVASVVFDMSIFGYISGGYDGISSSQTLIMRMAAGIFGSAGVNPPYPSLVDGGLVIVPTVLLGEGVSGSSTGPLRGVFPGLAAPMAVISGSGGGVLLSGTRVVPTAGASRVYIVAQVVNGYNDVNSSKAPLIDLTGPWR